MERRIEVLGGFALLADGAPVALTARKGRALLGLLATARHRTLPRARLAATLWERADAEGARVSLRQALAQLRRAAGEGWVAAAGDDLRLEPGVATDVAEFDDALGRGDDATAVALYRGPFLEGASLDAPAAEAALGAERARLAGLAAEAMRREMARRDGRVEAMRIAHRLLAIEPLDEGAHRCLMAWDAAHGARGAARARFDRLTADLAREMGAAPEAETIALMDRIRRGGGEAARAPAPPDPGTATEAGPALLVLALEGDAPLDPGVLHDAAAGSGGEAATAGPGEAVARWAAGADLRDAADAALAVASDTGASIALLDVAGDEAEARALGRARRIAARAEPGCVLVAPALAARLGLAAGPDPVPLAPDAVPPRPELPLVGREVELAQIDGALAEVLGSGSGLVLHISGEAGIGKTRLASEAGRRAAARGAEVVRAGFAPFATQRRHIAQEIAALLPEDAGPPPEDPFDRAARAWLRAAALSPEDELRLSAMTDAARVARLRMALADRVTRAAGPAGLLLVVEDCHWAPSGAHEFLLDLAAALAEAPVTMVLTSRPDAASGLGHRLAAQARTRLLRLALAPLPAGAVAQLAAAAAPGRTDLAPAVARAAGHPLFLLRLIEAGWHDGALPESVTALVLEQIERLPSHERDALRRAAVLGAAFDPAEFAAIFPEAAVPRTRGDILHLNGPGLAFGHDLIRQAIHDDLPPPLRTDWHARAARYFSGVDPIRWAEHALLADDDAEAARGAMAAANALVADMRLRAAGGYVEAGLARAPADAGETVAELHSVRAGIRRTRGGLHGALDDYRAAHKAALADETRVAMLTRQALMLHRLDRGAEADRALDAAERLAEEIGLVGLGRAEIHEQRGNRAFVTGDYAECLRQHAAGLVLAEAAGDPRGIARAHGGLGDAHFAESRMRTAFHHFDLAVTSADRAGLGLVHQEFGFMRGYTLFFCEPGARAHVLADLAVEGAVGTGAARVEMIARETRAEMRLAALDLDGARTDIDRLAALLAAAPERRFAADLAILRAWLALREGRRAEGFAVLEPILEDARAQSYNGAVVLSLAALLARDDATRDAILRDGAARLEAGALSCAGLWFHSFTLERFIRDGEVARAAAEVETLQRAYASEPLGFVDLLARCVGTASDPTGNVASLRDDLAAARLDGFGALLGRVAPDPGRRGAG